MHSQSSIGLLILLPVALATISCGSKPSTTLPAERRLVTEQEALEPVGEERPAYLSAILDQTDRMSSSDSKASDFNPRIAQLEQRLRADPENVVTQVLLAQLYFARLDYRRGMTWTEKLVRMHPKLSDGHYILGNVYYDLGVGDMALRGLFKINGKGLMLFQPDATTKSILSRSIAEFDTASQLTETLTHRTPEGSITEYSDPDKSEQRRKQAAIYISGAPEEAVFTEDQAKAGIWLMLANNGTDKRAQDIVRKQLQFYSAESKRNGAGLLPNAVVSGAARQYGPRTVGQLGEMNRDSIEFIRKRAGLRDRSLLVAAAELGVSLPAWLTCGQIGSSYPDLATEAAPVVRASGDAILHGAGVLGIKFSSKALRQLRLGETSERLMPDQVDAYMRSRPESDRARRVFLITSRETFLLLRLSLLRVEEWKQKLPSPQVEELANFADMTSDPQAKRDNLRNIILVLTDSASRGDFAGIDSGTDSLKQWCDDILLSVITANG